MIYRSTYESLIHSNKNLFLGAIMDLILKNEQVIQTLASINQINCGYVGEQSQNLKRFSKSQSPVATLVMCCDSRAHTTSFTQNPENNFFIVRNIGNQYLLNQGCVEFGLRVLHTPLLIFLGHTHCGAISAAMGDYSNLPSSIIREIDHLIFAIKKSELHGTCQQNSAQAVVNNIHQQVDLGLKDFQDLRKRQELVIIGMVLDLDNSIKNGYGRISVVNVNGETDTHKLQNMPLVDQFF